MRDESDVAAALRRMLQNGPMTGLPRQARDLDLLLDLAAARLEAGRDYAEAALNEALQQWLSTFSAPHGIDHVTLRRSLVDTRRLVRDRAGSLYRVASPQRLGLTPQAAQLLPGQVLRDIQREREQRKAKAPAPGRTA